jgi:23S rRNA pseudouridine1911/1915/1917 synthase
VAVLVDGACGAVGEAGRGQLAGDHPARTGPAVGGGRGDRRGLSILLPDGDIVVVDKPSGLGRATRARRWADRAGSRWPVSASAVSTSGAEERRGIVHRLDVGDHGVMVVALSERAYSVLRGRVPRTAPWRRSTTPSCRVTPDPSAGTIDGADRPAPVVGLEFAVVAGGRESITHYETIEAFPSASLLRVHLENRPHAPDRVHLRPPGTRVSATGPTAPTRPLAAGLGLTRQWLHARSLAACRARISRRRALGGEFTSACVPPHDLSAIALERCWAGFA